MGNLDTFINFLEEQVRNHSIYVFGAQGQGSHVISESWISKMETTPRNAQRAIAYWRKQVDAGYGNVLRAFDCSGLGMCELYTLFGYPDMTANSMYNKLCDPIKKSDLCRGDWVFKADSTGKVTHIGYVVDNNLNVIEAKGRDDGVVKLPLSRGAWNKYGRPICFYDEIVNTWIATRPLSKGCKGTDVAELQRHLIEKGFSCGKWGDDGSYGNATVEAVREFQRSYFADPKEWDGKAGRKTLTALGAICKW